MTSLLVVTTRRGGARLSDGADHGCYGLGHSFTDLGGYLFCIARINPRLDCSAALRAGCLLCCERRRLCYVDNTDTQVYLHVYRTDRT